MPYLVQNSFNGGEWSPHLWGRQEDVESYRNSCRQVTNFELLVQGAARFRSGFQYVRRNPDPTAKNKPARLMRFEFGTTQPYLIEFGDSEITIYRDRATLTHEVKNITGATKADPCVITATAHGYNDGDEVFIVGVNGMNELNNRYFIIDNKTADTFELVGLDSTDYEAYTSGGQVAKVYKLASPYTADQVFEIGFTQSADTIYLVHKDVPPYQLKRLGDTNWVFEEIKLRDGVFKDQNVTATTLGLSGTSGSVSVTASSTTGINGDQGFLATDVGRLIRWRSPANKWTWLEITAHTSTTQVTATIKGANASNTTATTAWRLGAFSDTDGYPSTVVFFQDRLVFMNAKGEPLGVFLSVSADYTNFAASDEDGQVFGNSAIVLYLNSNSVNEATWGIPLGHDLVIGTSSSEWTLGANTAGEALTAVTAVAKEGTTMGSAPVHGIKVNNTALFVAHSQTSVGRIAFSFETNMYEATDMNLFANHILRGGIKQLAYMFEPENRLFLCTTNGELYMMAYKPDQSVNGWSRVLTSGKVLSIVALPSTLTKQNELYMIVEREINGEVYRFTEVQYFPFDIGEHVEEAKFLDCSVRFDGRSKPDADLTFSDNTGTVTITASDDVFANASVDDDIRINGNIARITDVVSDAEVSAIVLSNYIMPDTAKSGAWEWLRRLDALDRLWHLEGHTVSILADGATHPQRTITNGKIELDDKYHCVQIGLPYQGRLVSRFFGGGADFDGGGQGKIKRIGRFAIHMLDTLGGFYGVTSYDLSDTSQMDELQFRTTDDRMDQTTGLKSGIYEQLLTGGTTRHSSIVIEQRDPLPMTILSLMPAIEVHGV